jgi:cyclic pyranopterin phosphate synthase
MEVEMTDISQKGRVFRKAVASGEIRLRKKTVELIRKGKVRKGDPIQIAKIAGIQAAKMTPQLIPLCHQIPLEDVQIDTKVVDSGIHVTATVISEGKTGVEMEALVAASVALLGIWDMVKAYEKNNAGQYPSTSIEQVKVLSKVKRPIENS